MRKVNTPNDMTAGSRHPTNKCGDILVISYRSKSEVDIRFVDTGSCSSAWANKIRLGEVRDAFSPSVCGVGFVGRGGHLASVKGRGTPAYECWNRMIKRAYSENYHSTHPTYADCSVVNEWHNFQVFAEWYEVNAKLGLALDKDILVDGNKVYGPEFCSFVTASENTVKAHARSFSLASPAGEAHKGVNVREFCRSHGLSHSHIISVLNGKAGHHKGWIRSHD